MSDENTTYYFNTQTPSTFWSRHQRGRQYLTASDKAALTLSGETFQIQSVREGIGRYGPRWELDLELRGGAVKTLTMTKTDARDPFMTDLARECAGTGAVPASLERFETGQGYAYAIQPPREDVPF